MLTDATIAASIILKEPRDQFVKNIPSNVLRGILDYTLDDIAELDPRLAVFYDYIAELSKLCKVLEKNI